ncbi:MAG: response regulator [Methylococcales bacterium]|nr:response regulator [Methylococcales bacterium]
MSVNLSNKTILVIEDNAVMRRSMRDMLYTLGAQTIYEAENGIAAIDSMTKHQFDIVLCDFVLGSGKNGQQILEEAKFKNLITYDTIFIIVSAHQSADFVLSSIENKPDEYIAKPFNPQQLIRRLEKSYQRKKFLSPIEKEIVNGNYARAIHHCDKSIEKGNKAFHSQLLKLRAELAIKVADFQKAGTIYQEILQQRELAWARLGTGIIAFFQGQYELSIGIFEDLLVQNPMLMECYDWLTKSYEAVGLHEKAKDTLNQATKISPQSLSRQKKLAILAEKTGHLGEAEKAYLATAQLSEYSVHKTPSDFFGLAKIYSKKNLKMEALKTLEDMRQQFTGNPEADLRAATLETEIYQEIGNDKLSRQSFQKVKRLKKRLKGKTPIDLQLEIAKTYYLKEDPESADKIISELIHSHIDDDNFIDDIRQMHSDIGQNNHSEVLIQQTKQELIHINNQGVGLYKKGEFKQALSFFEKAIEEMPNNKTIILNMAKIRLHELKENGITQETLLQTHHYIKRAEQVGIAVDKLGSLKIEFEKLTRTLPE